ncbi:hypothetical protein So717_11770 [Roseobacter cerasinus]|uniref:DUF883 domain-containing protein n=1 Tax=Roseobacter cerasinus TaxID=2602289 RepID=A0A640VP66_9RHOB|nr:DUF883 family protein [Roseobacter cerasinus]GFE49424.1 hypothetical protein So717_11770 [Roseobacter cerasinus]
MAQTRTNGKVETSDVAAQIDTIKGDIAALTSMMTELAQNKSQDAKTQAATAAAAFKSSATDAANHAQVKAVETGEKLRSDAEAAYRTAEDTVRQQPALAVGLAAGLGFLVGMMATRRS